MISLLCALLLSTAQAAPGRFTAGLTAGSAPGGPAAADAGHLVLRGSADYGLLRRLSLTGELGTLPGTTGLALAAGPWLEVVDARWWRLGLVALPEVQVPLDQGRARLVGHGGLRLGWLAFWGVSFTARADWVQPLGPRPGRLELGGGLSVRM